MATTTPDNLFNPNPSDNYNLLADWATSMQSVQTALTRRANMYVGTSTKRTAFTTAPEGVHWQDTDGVKREYVRKSGVWVAANQRATGSRGSITLTGGSVATVEVALPSGMFQAAPTILISSNCPVAWSPQPTFRVLSRSATSFTVQVFSSASRTEVAFDWGAFGD